MGPAVWAGRVGAGEWADRDEPATEGPFANMHVDLRLCAQGSRALAAIPRRRAPQRTRALVVTRQIDDPDAEYDSQEDKVDVASASAASNSSGGPHLLLGNRLDISPAVPAHHGFGTDHLGAVGAGSKPGFNLTLSLIGRLSYEQDHGDDESRTYQRDGENAQQVGAEDVSGGHGPKCYAPCDRRDRCRGKGPIRGVADGRVCPSSCGCRFASGTEPWRRRRAHRHGPTVRPSPCPSPRIPRRFLRNEPP